MTHMDVMLPTLGERQQSKCYPRHLDRLARSFMHLLGSNSTLLQRANTVHLASVDTLEISRSTDHD